MLGMFMTDTGGTCEYVLDPDNPETWRGKEGDKCYVDDENLNDEGLWLCPHNTEKEKSLCIFHLPPSQKDNTETVDEFLKVLERVNQLNEGQKKKSQRQFIAARFKSLDLSKITLDGSANHPIDFRHAKFNGESIFDGLIVNSRINFRGADFDKTSFFNVTFDDWVTFNGCRFKGFADFRRTECQSASAFMNCTFESGVTFQNTEFNEWVDFRKVTFEQEAIFWRAVFNSEADFTDTIFNHTASFEDIEFLGEVKFTRSKLGLGSGFSKVDITEADFSDANLRNANLESSLLSRATLFGADLRGAKLSGAVLGDVRIDDDTKFLGHPSDDGDTSPHTISAIRSRPTCVYDPDYEGDNEHTDVDKAKSVYRALEKLGGKHARPRLQARSFVRRQDLQKDGYKQDAKQANSWEERLIAGARYSRAKVARATLLYGESPWRVIAYSLSIILGFALLFPLGGWMKPEGGDPMTYAQIASNPSEILNSVYYSTLTFTALGFGDFKPVGFGRALTTIETGLGAVLLALLVFILGRRAAR